MNIFEHDNLKNPSIDDIMGDYVESPECKRRIEEFNKKYFKLRENLLPYRANTFRSDFYGHGSYR